MSAIFNTVGFWGGILTLGGSIFTPDLLFFGEPIDLTANLMEIKTFDECSMIGII